MFQPLDQPFRGLGMDIWSRVCRARETRNMGKAKRFKERLLAWSRMWTRDIPDAHDCTYAIIHIHLWIYRSMKVILLSGISRLFFLIVN